MIINDVKIKKYHARVKDRNMQTTSLKPINADGYKIVEGYVSIASIILNDNEPTKPKHSSKNREVRNDQLECL